MTKLVTIIIVNWNGKKHLSECLKSLYKQSFNNFDIFFVDNGSVDGSVNFVKSNFPSVRIIQLEKNIGFSGGNNVALRIVKSKYICLLNNDTVADEKWLEHLVRNAESTSNRIGIFASKMLSYFNSEIIDSAGDGYRIIGEAYKRGEKQIDKGLYSENEIIFSACAGAALYRREVFERIGYFDDILFSPAIHEDSDLSFRALIYGYYTLFVAKAVVYHKISSTLGSLNSNIIYLSQRNSEFVFLKNMPTILLLLYFPLHIYVLLKSFISLSFQGYAIAFLKAKLHAIKSIKIIYIERQKIQKNRKISIAMLRRMLELPPKLEKIRRLIGIKENEKMNIHEINYL